MQFLNYHRRWVRSGRSASGSGGPYPFRIFSCRDGWVVVICRSTAEWEAFVALLGGPDWTRRPEFNDPVVIAEHHAEEVSALVTAALADRTVADLVDAGRLHRVPLAAVRTIAEAVCDPPAVRRRRPDSPAVAGLP